jgi:predicted Zn-dependent protease
MTSGSRKEQLEALLVDDPHDPFLRYALAMELEATGDTNGAIVQLQNMLLDSPEYVPGYLQVGQLLIKSNRVPEAQEMLKVGMQTAFKQADHHSYQEMEGILASVN